MQPGNILSKIKRGQISSFSSLKTINSPAIVSTKLTGHKVPRVVS